MSEAAPEAGGGAPRSAGTDPATAASEPPGVALHLEGVGYAYPGGRRVLDGVSLEIRAGERFGIIGPSGAGKSTLLLHLNGLLLPDAGRVRVGGEPVEKRTLARVRRAVGLVFQDPDDQLFNPTVRDDVAFGPRNLGLSEAEVEVRVHRALERVELAARIDDSPQHLSYGERKRAALATVLAMEPGVVALDEPFSNLHPALVRRLVEVLRQVESTLVVVSQEILPVLGLCQRVAVVTEGRVRWVGPVPELMENRGVLTEAGLDFDWYCSLCRGLRPEGGR